MRDASYCRLMVRGGPVGKHFRRDHLVTTFSVKDEMTMS